MDPKNNIRIVNFAPRATSEQTKPKFKVTLWFDPELVTQLMLIARNLKIRGGYRTVVNRALRRALVCDCCRRELAESARTDTK